MKKTDGIFEGSVGDNLMHTMLELRIKKQNKKGN